MRARTLIGGAVVGGAAAVIVALVHARGSADTPGPAVAPAIDSSSLAAPAEGEEALGARRLGLILLTSSDAQAIRAGMESLAKAAGEGDAEADVALGRIYLRGLPTVPRDVARARESFVRADAAHHPSAAYYLGVMTQRGEGVQADPAAAAHWLEIAAREGSPHAMFLLANAYRAGAGVQRDDAKALALYAKAAELEYPAALQALALAYGHGEMGLAPDDAESRRYAMEAEHAVKHPPSLP